jgi:hypothetical protein
VRGSRVARRRLGSGVRRPLHSHRAASNVALSIIREALHTARAMRKTHFLLFRRSLSPSASSPFDGPLPWVDGHFR